MSGWTLEDAFVAWRLLEKGGVGEGTRHVPVNETTSKLGTYREPKFTRKSRRTPLYCLL